MKERFSTEEMKRFQKFVTQENLLKLDKLHEKGEIPAVQKEEVIDVFINYDFDQQRKVL
jgi:hypothetical protein